METPIPVGRQRAQTPKPFNQLSQAPRALYFSAKKGKGSGSRKKDIKFLSDLS